MYYYRKAVINQLSSKWSNDRGKNPVFILLQVARQNHMCIYSMATKRQKKTMPYQSFRSWWRYGHSSTSPLVEVRGKGVGYAATGRQESWIT